MRFSPSAGEIERPRSQGNNRHDAPPSPVFRVRGAIRERTSVERAFDLVGLHGGDGCRADVAHFLLSELEHSAYIGITRGKRDQT